MYPMPMMGQGPIRYPRQTTPIMPTMPTPVAGPRPSPIGGMPMRPVSPVRPVLGAFHKGGTVKKTGAYQLLKGEKVLVHKAKKRQMPVSKHKMVSMAALGA